MEQDELLNNHVFYKHLGVYAYRLNVLKKITSLQQTPLEKVESLEQLRWLEHGYKIKVGVTNIETTPNKDLLKRQTPLHAPSPREYQCR